MSLTAAAIRLMASKGMTADDIADIAEAMEKPVPELTPDALLKKRERDAARMREKREREAQEKSAARVANDVAHDVAATSRDKDAPHTCASAQVVTPSSSLRSEEEDTPKNPSGSAPKGAARSKSRERRSRFVPEDWNPTEADTAYAVNLGFSPGEIERELAKFRRYEFARPYSHWSRTYHTWLDRAAERKPRQAHERPHADPKFLARHANYADAAEGARRVVEAARRRREPSEPADPFWTDPGS